LRPTPSVPGHIREIRLTMRLQPGRGSRSVSRSQRIRGLGRPHTSSCSAAWLPGSPSQAGASSSNHMRHWCRRARTKLTPGTPAAPDPLGPRPAALPSPNPRTGSPRGRHRPAGRFVFQQRRDYSMMQRQRRLDQPGNPRGPGRDDRCWASTEPSTQKPRRSVPCRNAWIIASSSTASPSAVARPPCAST